MDKKNVQVTFHCTDEVKRQLSLLAEHNDLTLSQYAFKIIESHLAEKAYEHSVLSEVFNKQ